MKVSRKGAKLPIKIWIIVDWREFVMFGLYPEGMWALEVYLEKAGILFEEMGLEQDLDDLDRLKADHGL